MSTRWSRPAFGILAFLLVVRTAAPAPPAEASIRSASQYAAARADRIVEALVEEQNLPGLSVVVGIGEEVVFARGLGWADIENRVPVEPDTRFRLGSVSKLLTAAAVAKLHEEGRLDLDAPVQAYVPTFPQKEYPITSRQLAAHLGGIRHYREGGYFNHKQYASVTESLEIFQDDPLLHEPGTEREYSTYGYVLLSAVVEGASGALFLDYMRTSIFDPLGMDATGPEYATELIPHRARFYERDDEGGFVNALPEDYSYKWAGGGFMSTSLDLVRFGLAVTNGTLFSDETMELVFTPQTKADSTPVREGIGWRNDVDWKGRRVAHHGGASEGARAFLLVYPDASVAVAMLANVAGANLFEGEAETIGELFVEDGAPSARGGTELSGLYSFTAETGGETTTGTLYLRPEEAGEDLGWVSRFFSTDAPIVASFADEGTTRLVVATSRGLVRFWLHPTDEGFAGEWGYAKPERAISGRRVAQDSPGELSSRGPARARLGHQRSRR